MAKEVHLVVIRGNIYSAWSDIADASEEVDKIYPLSERQFVDTSNYIETYPLDKSNDD